MPPAAYKFADVPKDADTRIQSQREINIDGIDALHQRWVWDGTIGQSLIFCAGDVAEATDQAIIDVARDTGLITPQSKCTFNRSESGFVFVNFGFEVG